MVPRSEMKDKPSCFTYPSSSIGSRVRSRPGHKNRNQKQNPARKRVSDQLRILQKTDWVPSHDTFDPGFGLVLTDIRNVTRSKLNIYTHINNTGVTCVRVDQICKKKS